MAWIDISRNIKSINPGYERTPLVKDLFVYGGTLYAIVQSQSRNSSGPVETRYKYTVWKHLGADPPVVDTIWSLVGDFAPLPGSSAYKGAGKVELNGNIYIGNRNTGEVYVNSTTDAITSSWNILAGPFGAPENTGASALLADLKVYNGSLYAAHVGGVSRFIPSTKVWQLVGAMPLRGSSAGEVRSLLSFGGRLHAGVKHLNVGVVYVYDEITNKWNLVAELPPETTDPSILLSYNNELVVVAKQPNKNVFFGRDISLNFQGVPQFLQGDHLKGIPDSAVLYQKDGSIWAACTDGESYLRDYIAGDLNGDGIVDARDLTALLDAAFMLKFPVTGVASTDVNGDGYAANISDVTHLNAYLAGSIPKLNTTLTVGYRTMSRNKISGITEDSAVGQESNVFQASSFYRSLWREPTILSNLSMIIPRSESARKPSPTELTTEMASTVNGKCAIYSNPIGNLLDPLAVYTVTFTLSTPIIDQLTGFDTERINKLGQLRCLVGLGQVENESANTYEQFFTAASHQVTDPTITALFPQTRIISDEPEVSITVSYTFTLQDFPKNLLSNVRLKILVDTPQANLGILSFQNTTSAGVPIPSSYAYAWYAPTAYIRNLSIKDVVSGAEYIVQKPVDVPANESVNHSTASPSGPDEWFVKLPGATTGLFPTLRNPRTLPDRFSGKMLREVISNIPSLDAGQTYFFNMLSHVLPSPTPVNMRISVILENRDRYKFINYRMAGPTLGVQNISSLRFSTSLGLSSPKLTNLTLRIRVEDDIAVPAATTAQIKLSPDVYLSDINLIQLISGSTENLMYRYRGQEWTKDLTSVADPVIQSGIPKINLIENFDRRSNAFQLYATGGGRAWVWDYQGGLYSGSKFGPDQDVRPQIVSIM